MKRIPSGHRHLDCPRCKAIETYDALLNGDEDD